MPTPIRRITAAQFGAITCREEGAEDSGISAAIEPGTESRPSGRLYYAARLRASRWRNQLNGWFELVKMWAIISKSLILND